jgi:hypothetical protein
VDASFGWVVLLPSARSAAMEGKTVRMMAAAKICQQRRIVMSNQRNQK